MKFRLCLLFMMLCLAPPAQAAGNFPNWLNEFRQEAHMAGISEATLAALNGLTLDDRVIALDQSQPEGKSSFAKYRQNVINDDRVAQGRALLKQYRQTLQKISATSGVPAEVIIALWGIESSFGKLQGKFSVLRSLATLAYDGRRAALFRRELLAALKIIERGDVAAADLRGSWAGAMGQSQFMPSTYLNYAVDGNGDGTIDIWRTVPDVLASIAHYLQSEGWQGGKEWGRAVTATQPIAASMIGVKITHRPASAWRELGITETDGMVLTSEDDAPYFLVQPDGASGDSYLATSNYQAIMRWNRSTYFATAVGLLSDQIAGYEE